MSKNYEVEVSFPSEDPKISLSDFQKNLEIERPDVEWLVLPTPGISKPDILSQNYPGTYPAKNQDPSLILASRHEDYLATIERAFQGKPHTPEPPYALGED